MIFFQNIFRLQNACFENNSKDFLRCKNQLKRFAKIKQDFKQRKKA